MWTCSQGHQDDYTVRQRSNRPGTYNECRACRRKRQNREYREQPVRKARALAWRAANPEKVRALRERNAEYHREKNRQWYLANKALVIWRARARRMKYDAGDLTAEQWRRIVVLAQARCLACGRDDQPLTIDHVVPLSRDGKHTVTNVQPLCSTCNKRKFTKIIDYRPEGWVVV